MFDAVSVIESKRDGREVPGDQIAGMVRAYLADEVSDAQMAAFFMAGVLQGFTVAEAAALADAYVASGEVVDLSSLRGPTVDKHSTGGVGDTTTFVVGPIVAACGRQLAKLSGRGLGHTGGTLDKLQAIPGLRVDLSPAEVRDQVESIGLAVAAATADIVPADKRTYALRDVTGTVPSRALIAASIMSKKLAGGAQTVVLDVKVGDGAFLPAPDVARDLAELCVGIGEAHGRRTSAVVTDMSQPLGRAIGNALEVREAVRILQGGAGALRDVSIALAARMLELTGDENGVASATAALDDGRALEAFRAMVTAQGGDVRAIDEPDAVLASAPIIQDVPAPRAGNLAHVACKDLGLLSVRMGAGRLSLDDVVDPAVGLEVLVRIGDEVEVGQPIARVHAADRAGADAAAAKVIEALVIGDDPVDAVPLLHAVVG